MMPVMMLGDRSPRAHPAGPGRPRMWRLVVAIVVLMVAPLVLYLGVGAALSTRARITFALTSNGHIAQAGRDLIEEQYGRMRDVMHLLAQRRSMRIAPAPRAAALARHDLAEVVGLLRPELMLAGLFDADGTPVSSAPPGAALPPRQMLQDAFALAPPDDATFACGIVPAPASRRPPVPAASGVVFARRIGGPLLPDRFLVAQYRLEGVRSWVTWPDVPPSVAVFIVPRRGRPEPVPPTAGTSSSLLPGAAMLARVRRDREGSIAPAPEDEQPTLTSFAYAPGPQWVVVVRQSQEAAMRPTRMYLLEVALFGSMALVVIALAARATIRQYRRQAELTLRLAAQNEQLRTADRTKSDFLDNVSHDLLTPLASIKLSLSGLLSQGVAFTPLQQRQRVQMAHDQTERVISRVRNLLEMTRLEADADRSQMAPCDLAEIIDGALDRLAPLVRGRTVETLIDMAPLMFYGRAGQIEMAVMNLLDNALKYSPADRPLVVRGDVRDGEVYFSLRDHGPGVRAEDREIIFEKFQRAGRDPSVGGTGLGLAICKRIVESHGGLIGVINAAGGGAEFWFTIPVTPRPREKAR